MKSRVAPALTTFMVTLFVAAVPLVYGQTSKDFTSEPDKSMASAQESFLKKDMNKAAEHIRKAAAYVRKEGDKVSKDAKQGVIKASEQLTKLEGEVKKGTVKSEAELKKTFAQVDHQLAMAWHTTADEARKLGKDSTEALQKAGAGLEGAAKWSGNQLQEGTQASVDSLKKVGKGVGKGVGLGAEDVGKFFKNIGDGIGDMGRKLSS
jgi:hypothetical protein